MNIWIMEVFLISILSINRQINTEVIILKDTITGDIFFILLIILII